MGPPTEGPEMNAFIGIRDGRRAKSYIVYGKGDLDHVYSSKTNDRFERWARCAIRILYGNGDRIVYQRGIKYVHSLFLKDVIQPMPPKMFWKS